MRLRLNGNASLPAQPDVPALPLLYFYSRPTLSAVASPGLTPAVRNWISISRHDGGEGEGEGARGGRVTRKEEDTWSYCFVMATRPFSSAAPRKGGVAGYFTLVKSAYYKPLDRMSPQSRVSLRFAPAEARRSSRSSNLQARPHINTWTSGMPNWIGRLKIVTDRLIVRDLGRRVASTRSMMRVRRPI